MTRVLLGVLLWASANATTWACPVCFRMEEGPVSAGVRAAVIVLMTVTVSVLLGFAIFIRGFVRRSRIPEPRPPSQCFGEPRRSSKSGGGNLVELRNLGTPEPRNR